MKRVGSGLVLVIVNKTATSLCVICVAHNDAWT